MRHIGSTIGILYVSIAGTAWAETRQLDSHEHGSSAPNIAVEGKIVAMELEAPGVDIVGFEHPADSAEDKATIAAGKARLEDGAGLFTLPDAAGCDLERASAELVQGGAHHGHDHGSHAGGDGETHSEFYATYRFGCADPDQITEIGFPFFDAFPNAERLRVQFIDRSGSTGFEVERSAPSIRISVDR